jgi:hypothetical protein
MNNERLDTLAVFDGIAAEISRPQAAQEWEGVRVEGDVDSIPTVDLAQAKLMIEAADEAREDEAEGEGDFFHYNSNPWFLLKTTSGLFVGQIRNASGGGRVSFPPDPEKDFDNLSISYNLYARVVEHADLTRLRCSDSAASPRPQAAQGSEVSA